MPWKNFWPRRMVPGHILSNQWHGYGYLKIPSQYFANIDYLLYISKVLVLVLYMERVWAKSFRFWSICIILRSYFSTNAPYIHIMKESS
jgi:hypothetical protein